MSLISLLFRASVSKVQCYFMGWVISIVLSLFVRSKESFESFNVDIVRLQMLRFVKSFARRKGLRRTMVVLRMPMLWTCAQTLIISWAVVFVLSSSLLITLFVEQRLKECSFFFCRDSFVEPTRGGGTCVESGKRKLAVAFSDYVFESMSWYSVLLSRRFNGFFCDEWFRLCLLNLFRSKESFESFKADAVCLQTIALLIHLRSAKVRVGRWYCIECRCFGLARKRWSLLGL